MTFNIGEFMFKVMQLLYELPTKLYDIINYPVNISWVSKVIEFFGGDLALPDSISLISVLGGLSAVTIVVLIIYNLFKF